MTELQKASEKPSNDGKFWKLYSNCQPSFSIFSLFYLHSVTNTQDRDDKAGEEERKREERLRAKWRWPVAVHGAAYALPARLLPAGGMIRGEGWQVTHVSGRVPGPMEGVREEKGWMTAVLMAPLPFGLEQTWMGGRQPSRKFCSLFPRNQVLGSEHFSARSFAHTWLMS